MTTLEEALLCYLLDDICLDMAFEIHRSIRTEGMTLEELYDMKPFPSNCFSKPSKRVTTSINCGNCERPVHVSRYAQHLDKCMTTSNPNRRSSTKQIRDQVQKVQQLALPDVTMISK